MTKALLPFFAFLAFCSNTLCAQVIVRIEEDWELQITHPDEALDAPQITMMMIPFGNTSDLLFQFDINHGRDPVFSSGGFQVRVTEDEECLDSYRLHKGLKLSQHNELVSWTQVVQKVDNGCYFGVANGQSTSLGSFGDFASAAFVSNGDLGTASLNGYRIENSVENSGVTYAANRVDHLRLKTVRVYSDQGQIAEIAVNADIQQSNAF